MNRIKAAVGASVALAATMLGATTVAHADTDACVRVAHNICSTPNYRTAVARLSARPALILPGQWQDPAGPVLVAECLASYPNRRLAPANAELMSCLTAPDPRRSDRRVMTVHQYHLNHVNHLNHR